MDPQSLPGKALLRADRRRMILPLDEELGKGVISRNDLGDHQHEQRRWNKRLYSFSL